jgi:hypothetical protein
MARDPLPANGPDRTAVTSGPPTTPAQKAALDRKLAHVAVLAQSKKNGTNGGATAALTAYGEVSTIPRNADTNYYCGPAAIQVVSDYSWGVYKKYPQSTLASMAGTTPSNGTGITAERNVLQWAISGSPKNWFYYVVAQPTDGSYFSILLQSDVIYDAMPIVMNLTPWAWDPSIGQYRYLVNWRNYESVDGHYVVGSGVYGGWDGTAGPELRFDDSAGGALTGSFWDSQYNTYYLISHWYNYIIW